MASTRAALSQSASAPVHSLRGGGAADAGASSPVGMRRAATEGALHSSALPASQSMHQTGSSRVAAEPTAATTASSTSGAHRCCGDFCSQALEAALGLGQSSPARQAFQLPFKSILCARAEEAVVGEPFLGAVAAQCLVMAREDALSSQPEAQDLADQCLALAQSLRGNGAEVGNCGDEAPGGTTHSSVVMSGAAEEAVRMAVERRFSQLESAWKAEALVRAGVGPDAGTLVEEMNKAHLRQGVAPLTLWEKEDAARAVCYMSALGHLHPARYYRPRDVCACCFVIYSSLDEQRAALDRQRSNERQVIARAALVADRRRRQSMPSARHALEMRPTPDPKPVMTQGRGGGLTVAERSQELLGPNHDHNGIREGRGKGERQAMDLSSWREGQSAMTAGATRAEGRGRSEVAEMGLAHQLPSEGDELTSQLVGSKDMEGYSVSGSKKSHAEGASDALGAVGHYPLRVDFPPPHEGPVVIEAVGAPDVVGRQRATNMPAPLGIPPYIPRQHGSAQDLSPSVLGHTSLALARDKSPIRSRSPSSSAYFEPSGFRPGTAQDPSHHQAQSQRLPVDRPLPRPHAKALFKFIGDTTCHIQGAWDHQAFHLPPEDRASAGKPAPARRRVDNAKDGKKKIKKKPAQRITESQLTYALRRWRLRRAQSHRRVENEKLIRRVLGALEACRISVTQWVDALQARHRAQHLRPVGGHRRARGKRWQDISDELPPGDETLGQLELLQGLKQLADVASKHPGDPDFTSALLSSSSTLPRSVQGDWDQSLNKAGVYESSWILLPEEAERFVYLLLRYHADLVGEARQEAPAQVSATTLIETRVLRDFLLSCEKADSEMLSTEKETRILDEAFLWLDGYLRIHQLKAGNLLREINMAHGVDQGVFVDSYNPKERTVLLPGSIADQRKWKMGTVGQYEASVSLVEFLAELCPRQTKSSRSEASKKKGSARGHAAITRSSSSSTTIAMLGNEGLPPRVDRAKQRQAIETRRKADRARPMASGDSGPLSSNKEGRRKARKEAAVAPVAMSNFSSASLGAMSNAYLASGVESETPNADNAGETPFEVSLSEEGDKEHEEDQETVEDLHGSQRIDRMAMQLLENGGLTSGDGLFQSIGTSSLDAAMDGGFLPAGALDFAADLLSSAIQESGGASAVG